MSEDLNKLDEGMSTPPKSGSWKPGRPGDVVKGTYVGSKPFEGDYGPTTIYNLKVIVGQYHQILDGKKNITADEPTVLTEGEVIGVFEHPTFKDQIARAQPGQKVLLRFTEWKKTKDGRGEYKFIDCKLEENFDPTSVV